MIASVVMVINNVCRTHSVKPRDSVGRREGAGGKIPSTHRRKRMTTNQGVIHNHVENIRDIVENDVVSHSITYVYQLSRQAS